MLIVDWLALSVSLTANPLMRAVATALTERYGMRQEQTPGPPLDADILARNAGRILTHRQILNDIWGPAHEHDLQYLRVFVGRLRAKLGDDPSAPRFILNEPGVGYRFLD